MVTKPLHARLSIQAKVLVVSPLAIFLCIGILAFLITLTCIVYVAQHGYFKLLPRDVEVPASLLGFVHASEKLQAWVKKRAELEKFQAGVKSRHIWRGWSKRGEKRENMKEDDILVGMGYLSEQGGKSRWGIEVDARTTAET